MSRHRKRRRNWGSSIKFEDFLMNYGLQIAGGLLIVGGLIYLFASSFNSHTLAELMKSFAKPSDEKSFVPSNTGFHLTGYQTLLFYIPGILFLGFAHFLKENRAFWKNILFSLGIIWLIFIEGKILLGIRYHSIELNYYLILITFCIIQIFTIIISIAGKSRLLLNWSVIWFFVSAIMIRFIYGVIIPNIIFLMLLQITASVVCYRYNWRSPFLLLMTLSSGYIFYYFLKFVIVAANPASAALYLLPSLMTWFILSVTGLGILNPGSSRKFISFILGSLPYVTLTIVLGLCLAFYYQSGINYLYLFWYLLTVLSLIIIAVLNRKYSFLKNSDTFYFSLCVFSAFMLPQLFYSNFFLVLSASLALALLVNVMLTDSRVSFHLSMGLFFVTLGLYLVSWVFNILPALITQRTTGTIYPLQMVLGSLLIVALSYFYNRLFTQLLRDYSFSYTQIKNYKSSVRAVHYSIIYLVGFLAFDYLLLLIIPDYRVNLIEWGLYTYTYLYFLLTSQNPKSRAKLRYVILLSLLAIFLYPVLIHPETIHFRALYTAGQSSALLPFIMHYFCVGVIILFILHVDGRLSLYYPKSRLYSNTRTILGIVFLCFILLSEYDHLVLLSVSRLSSESAYEILQYNKFIPYSVVLLSVSVILLVFSLIHYTKFLRRLSMLMILAVLIKVLFIDITFLSANKSIILLISLGAVLLASSFLVPWLRKQSQITKTSETGTLKQQPETKSE